MKRALWIIGLSLSALVGIAFTGVVGLVSSATLIMAPPDAAMLAGMVAAPAPRHDPAKPTVALLLGNTRTEATDFLAPYAMFAESGVYNVYAVAETRETRTLAGGVDVVPQLTFAELDARVEHGPDVIVVPAIEDVESQANARVLDWLRRHGDEATLLSWCVGAEVVAASGLVDGRPVTTHWGDIDALERAYPAIQWRRDVRYVDDGDLVTTGGITAGVDATLHFLATRHGRAVADRVAGAMHYAGSPFVDDPRAAQYSFEPVDAVVYLNLAFNWPKPTAAVWLYDGVGEIDLAAAVDTFGVTSANMTTTVASTSAVTSRHGLQILPRRQDHELKNVDRVLVPGGTGAGLAATRIPASLLRGGREATVLDGDQARAYAFTMALEELAASHDTVTAEYAARQLEVRSPVRLIGPRWAVTVVLVPMLAAVGGSIAMWLAVRLGQRINAWAGDRRRLTHTPAGA